MRAVETITDQTTLAKIVMAHKYLDVRDAAVRILSDHTALVKIAVEADEDRIRRAAVDKLPASEVILVKVAVEDEDYSTRRAAFNKLGEVELANFASTAAEPRIRSDALALLAIFNGTRSIPDEHRVRLRLDVYDTVLLLLDSAVLLGAVNS